MATTTVAEASTDGGAKGAPVWEKGAGPAGGGEPGHTRTVCFSSGNPRMESTRGVMHRNTTPDSGSADQLPIATENHHRLTTQLERQKQYYEGLLEDAKRRTDSSISLAVEKATSPELQRMQQDMKKVQEENKSLQQVNQIHLDNKKRRQQKSKERKERGTAKIKERDEQITNLEKQVQELMADIEAPKMRESSANAAELGEGTILPHSVSIAISNHPASNNIQPQTTPEVLLSQAISEIEKKERTSLLQKRPKDVKDSEIEKKERTSLLQKRPKDVKDSEIEKKERTSLHQKRPIDVKDSEIEKKERTWPKDLKDYDMKAFYTYVKDSGFKYDHRLTTLQVNESRVDYEKRWQQEFKEWQERQIAQKGRVTQFSFWLFLNTKLILRRQKEEQN